MEKFLPNYSPYLFKNDSIPADKNPSKLIKIVNLEKNCIENWIESSLNRKTKYCNYIVQFELQQKIGVGIITSIDKSFEGEIVIRIKTFKVGKVIGFEIPVLQILNESTEEIMINTKNIISFYCTVNYAKKNWIFPFN